MTRETLLKAGITLWHRLVTKSRTRLLVVGFFLLLFLFTLWGVRLARQGSSKPSKTGSNAPVAQNSAEDRPAEEAKSLSERMEAAKNALAQMEAETKARLGARDDNEFLCFAARDGQMATVARLLKRGVSINARDREGQSVLMHAVSGAVAAPSLYAVSDYEMQHPESDQVSVVEMVTFLLSQPQIDVHLVSDRDRNNAFIAALAAETEPLSPLVANAVPSNPFLRPDAAAKYPSKRVIDLLKRRGATWPKPTNDPVRIPFARMQFTTADLPLDCRDLCEKLMSAEFPLGAFALAQHGELVRALSHIDLADQPHEPLVQREAMDTFRQGLTLLLNRLVGDDRKALPLYSTDEWRHVPLSPAIHAQILRMRQAERETHYDETAPAYLREVRFLNKLLLEHLLPALTAEGRRAAPLPSQTSAWNGSAVIPSSYSDTSPPRESGGTENGPSLAGSLGNNSAGYVRPHWTTESFLPEEREELPRKSLPELQDMIREIYAAAGKRYKEPYLYARYNQQRGYAGWTEAPSLSTAQSANVELLVHWRKIRRGY